MILPSWNWDCIWTVSYTHLDVYKRQNITESDSLEHLPHYEDSLAAVCELYSYNLEKGNSDYLTTYDIQINVLI